MPARRVITTPEKKEEPLLNLGEGGKLAAESVLGGLKASGPALILDLLNALSGGQAKELKAQEKEYRAEHGEEPISEKAWQQGEEKAKKYIPTTEKLSKAYEKATGLDEEPTGKRRIARNLGEYLQLVKGRGWRSTVGKTLGLAAGEEATGEIFGEPGREAFKVAAPIGVQGIEPLVRGHHPETGESTLGIASQHMHEQPPVGRRPYPTAEELYNYGSAQGLTDAQLTPLIQTEQKTNGFWSRFARNNRNSQRNLDEARHELGQQYQRLRAEGRAEGYLNPNQQMGLFQDLRNMHQDLRNSSVINNDTARVMDALEEFGRDLAQHPQDIERLMNTYVNLNGIPNWRGDPNRVRMLHRANDAIVETMRRKSPRIAREFEYTNRMYQKQAQVRRTLGQPLDSAETLLLEALAFGAVHGNTGAIKTVLAHTGLGELAREMITNPRLQGIHHNIIHALQTGNPRAIFKAAEKLAPYLKEEPEEKKSGARRVIQSKMGLEDTSNQ